MVKKAATVMTVAVLSVAMNFTPVVAIGEELQAEQDSAAIATEEGQTSSEDSTAQDQADDSSQTASEDVDAVQFQSATAEEQAETQPELSVNAHVANKGWLGSEKVDPSNSDQYFGTVGKGLQLEALQLNLVGYDDSYIQMRAHVANIGWMSSVDSRQGSVGTTGKGYGIEALQFMLKGSMADQYDLYYQVHSANFGWLGWAKNGESAGSQGYGRAVQAVRFKLVKKGENPDLGITAAFKLAKPMGVSVTAHVANRGWLKAVNDNAVAGTTGQGLAMEALRVSLDGAPYSGGVEMSAYVNGSWQGYVAGSCGTTGKSLPMQAVKLRLMGEMAEHYDIYYQAYVANIGWLGWTKDDGQAGSVGYGCAIEAVRVVLVEKGSASAPATGDSAFVSPKVTYSSHVANIGWMQGYTDDLNATITLGTTGKGKALQAFTLAEPGNADLSLSYGVHVSNIGTMSDVSAGQVAGTTGRGLPIESVHFKLSGASADNYDVWYRVHVSNVGWLGWTSNGNEAGSQGLSLPVEAVQVKVTPKGQNAPAAQGQSFLSSSVVKYAAYVANSGWSQEVTKGETAGTVGQSQPLKGIELRLDDGIAGHIVYATHVANEGWLPDVSDGAVSGSSNLSNNIEAVRISLTGDAASYYDVWYRVHVANIGWLGWTKNGSNAGSTGRGLSVQAIQVKVTRKGGAAPGSTDMPFALGNTYATANPMQRRIVDLAKTTPSPGPGLCSEWVAQVFSRAGFRNVHLDACDYYWRYCNMTDRNRLQVGMVIAVPSHSHTSAGRIWGHVCIYIGDGKVMDNIGRIRTTTLDYWLSFYSTTYTPKWGWYDNVPLA